MMMLCVRYSRATPQNPRKTPAKPQKNDEMLRNVTKCYETL